MAPARGTKKTKTPDDREADPDRLTRVRAGRYRTADERFEVEQSATGWFLIDSTITNELGQPLMHGPMATLDAVRAALPEAREAKAPTAPKAPKPPKGRGTAKEEPRAVTPPARTWIDDLPAADGQQVRSVIRRLEQEGISQAADLVRADREGLLPVLATRLIERRLEALVADLPAGERDRARELVRRAADLLSGGGTDLPRPLPRWALVEQRPGEEPESRRIILRGSGRRGT